MSVAGGDIAGAPATPGISAAAASTLDQAEGGGHLLTRDHEVIRQWADQRGALPAVIRDQDEADRSAALRFDFEGGDDQDLRPIQWDEWFDEFDRRDLVFIYLRPSEGEEGNFFRLESAER